MTETNNNTNKAKGGNTTFTRLATPATVAAGLAGMPIPVPAPEVAIVAARESASGPKYGTKCLYFPDKAKVAEIEALLAKYPRATLSTVVAQLVEPLLQAMQALPEGQRQVTFQARIWI